VGGANLIKFYVFIASIPLFFMFIMIVASILPLQIQEQQRNHHHYGHWVEN